MEPRAPEEVSFFYNSKARILWLARRVFKEEGPSWLPGPRPGREILYTTGLRYEEHPEARPTNLWLNSFFGFSSSDTSWLGAFYPKRIYIPKSLNYRVRGMLEMYFHVLPVIEIEKSVSDPLILKKRWEGPLGEDLSLNDLDVLEILRQGNIIYGGCDD